MAAVPRSGLGSFGGSSAERRIRAVILAGKPPEAISLHDIVPGTVRRISQDAVRRSVLAELAPPNATILSRVTPMRLPGLACRRVLPVLSLTQSTSIEIPGE
jgi:molybdate transport system ATP-binding protein